MATGQGYVIIEHRPNSAAPPRQGLEADAERASGLQVVYEDGLRAVNVAADDSVLERRMCRGFAVTPQETIVDAVAEGMCEEQYHIRSVV